MEQEQIRSLFKKIAAGNYTEEEHQQFIDWLKTASMTDVEAIAEEYKTIAEGKPIEATTNLQLIAEIESALDQYDLGTKESKWSPVKVIPLNSFRKIAAAAVIILMLGFGSYFIFFNNTPRQARGANEVAVTKDIPAPNTTKAYITLADGSKVFLDSAQNGSLATQGDVKVMKTGDGSVAYSRESALRQAQGDKEIKYNSLTVPQGSKPMTLMLADGSKIWLDAATTITYPTVFVGKERKVELITGQSYFEVAHNTGMPFIVRKGDAEIEVLGTHFNVNAYDDETMMKVTLLEGSVKVLRSAQDDKAVVIKPGQQVILRSRNESGTGNAQDDIRVVSGVDVDAVMAWKNGLFNFNNSDLQTVLRQLSRWYDVDVVYQGAIPKRNFGGEMQRDLNLSEVLKILEKNQVHFKIDGKRLIVLP